MRADNMRGDTVKICVCMLPAGVSRQAPVEADRRSALLETGWNDIGVLRGSLL